MIAFTLQLVFERRTSHPSACYAVDQRSADCWWFLWVCRPWGTLIFILLMLVWISTVSITAKFSSSKNSCPTSKNSRITSPSNKMGHLLTVQRRQSVCSITIHQTSSRHHFGLNPVDYKVYGVLQQRVYSRKIQTVDELKQRIIGEWECLDQRIIDNAVKQWCRRLRSCVAAKGGHFEHSL